MTVIASGPWEATAEAVTAPAADLPPARLASDPPDELGQGASLLSHRFHSV
ncbi:MAG: hypothetical protein K2X56_18400 [Mycobacterium pseudokansasii]|uniref:hypothetical protein n=1 Tax=Mycobacterium pseudokansasii TaxID=2341080 RepID=UPI00142E63AE|nr:hypothetical protein [Mycobacterium pseudokansasii]MBY0390001.1 hypothetical protein [Mycobacterium pseudokansasii]